MAESKEELKSFLMKVKDSRLLKTQHSEKEDHGIWSHHFMANRWGNNGNSDRLYFLGSKITADGDLSHEIETLSPGKQSYDQPRQHVKKSRHYFAN